MAAALFALGLDPLTILENQLRGLGLGKRATLGFQFHVKGIRETQHAFSAVERDINAALELELLAIGEEIAKDAAGRAVSLYPRSRATFRPVVRGHRARVRMRTRTKKLRPDFGALLLRTALEPAADADAAEFYRRLDLAANVAIRRHF